MSYVLVRSVRAAPWIAAAADTGSQWCFRMCCIGRNVAVALITLIYAAVLPQIRPYVSVSVVVISPKPATSKTQS